MRRLCTQWRSATAFVLACSGGRSSLSVCTRAEAGGACFSDGMLYDEGDASFEKNTGVASSGSEATAGEQPEVALTQRGYYAKRTSDPQTFRERMEFRRDHRYSRRRPLPDVPWRQGKQRTYLDDAERLYGRKETWQSIADPVLREKLVAILQDYLRDTLTAARVEARDATRYQRLCVRAAEEYRAGVLAGALGSPGLLREWAQESLKRGETSASSLSSSSSNGSFLRHDIEDGVKAVSSFLSDTGAAMESTLTQSGDDESGEDAKEQEKSEARRQRGAQAQIANTPATAGLPNSDVGRAPLSGFPFLRQRAVEGEETLDPSLVDWAAKYYPEDTSRTFAYPPRLRRRGSGGDGTESDEHSKGCDEGHEASLKMTSHAATSSVSPSGSKVLSRGARSRYRLQRSLRAHEDQHRATFDAEGVFFKVMEQGEEDERAPRPRAVRGSDADVFKADAKVVKVPWAVAAGAKQMGYSTDVLRAKEQLIRLSRGEDPETIP